MLDFCHAANMLTLPAYYALRYAMLCRHDAMPRFIDTPLSFCASAMVDIFTSRDDASSRVLLRRFFSALRLFLSLARYDDISEYYMSAATPILMPIAAAASSLLRFAAATMP